MGPVSDCLSQLWVHIAEREQSTINSRDRFKMHFYANLNLRIDCTLQRKCRKEKIGLGRIIPCAQDWADFDHILFFVHFIATLWTWLWVALDLHIFWLVRPSTKTCTFLKIWMMQCSKYVSSFSVASISQNNCSVCSYWCTYVAITFDWQ